MNSRQSYIMIKEMSETKEILEIKNITKRYKKREVMQGIDLQTTSGKCVAILGANGSGKSTLLAILAGVLKADEGEFLWQGKNLLKDSLSASKVIGYVPQGTPLLEELSAWDNLRLWYEKQDLERELKEGVLAMLGIGAFLKTPVCKMSGGMKKRLAIGCAVAGNPSVLLMDEPSAALDLECKERIINYIKDFRARGGIVLLATHDAQEIDICDEWYILKQGKLVPYAYDGNIHYLVGRL